MGVKMQYHKIRGVEKSVCTAEQKIAYNLAHAYAYEYRQTWKKDKDKYMRFQQSEFIYEAVCWCYKMWKTCRGYDKYNADAIESALRAGMENYFNGNAILCSYEEIGRTFPALYL